MIIIIIEKCEYFVNYVSIKAQFEVRRCILSQGDTLKWHKIEKGLGTVKCTTVKLKKYVVKLYLLHDYVSLFGCKWKSTTQLLYFCGLTSQPFK